MSLFNEGAERCRTIIPTYIVSALPQTNEKQLSVLTIGPSTAVPTMQGTQRFILTTAISRPTETVTGSSFITTQPSSDVLS